MSKEPKPETRYYRIFDTTGDMSAPFVAGGIVEGKVPKTEEEIERGLLKAMCNAAGVVLKYEDAKFERLTEEEVQQHIAMALADGDKDHGVCLCPVCYKSSAPDSQNLMYKQIIAHTKDAKLTLCAQHREWVEKSHGIYLSVINADKPPANSGDYLRSIDSIQRMNRDILSIMLGKDLSDTPSVTISKAAAKRFHQNGIKIAQDIVDDWNKAGDNISLRSVVGIVRDTIITLNKMAGHENHEVYVPRADEDDPNDLTDDFNGGATKKPTVH